MHLQHLANQAGIIDHRIAFPNIVRTAFIDNHASANRLFAVGNHLRSNRFAQTLLFQSQQGFNIGQLAQLHFGLARLDFQLHIFFGQPLVFAQQVILRMHQCAAVFVPLHRLVGHPLQRIKRSGDIAFGRLHRSIAAIQHKQRHGNQRQQDEFVGGANPRFGKRK